MKAGCWKLVAGHASALPIILLQPRYVKGTSQKARGGSQYGTALTVVAIGFGDAAQVETEKQRYIIQS